MGLKLGVEQLRFDSVPLGTKSGAASVAASSPIPHLSPSSVWVTRRFLKPGNFTPPPRKKKKNTDFKLFFKKKMLLLIMILPILATFLNG